MKIEFNSLSDINNFSIILPATTLREGANSLAEGYLPLEC